VQGEDLIVRIRREKCIPRVRELNTNEQGEKPAEEEEAERRTAVP
jgi:hypothetical protein